MGRFFCFFRDRLFSFHAGQFPHKEHDQDDDNCQEDEIGQAIDQSDDQIFDIVAEAREGRREGGFNARGERCIDGLACFDRSHFRQVYFDELVLYFAQWFHPD